MAYCVKCGAQVDHAVQFCPHCGEKIPQQENAQSEYENYTQQNEYGNNTQQSEYKEYTQQSGPESTEGQNTYDRTEYYDPYEVKKNKAMGVLSYLGILVLIPLLTGDKRSEYVRHHANQGLILFILSFIIDLLEGKWVWGLHAWLNFGGSILSWMFDIAGLACFILMVAGIVTACKGEKRKLPVIGKYQIWK